MEFQEDLNYNEQYEPEEETCWAGFAIDECCGCIQRFGSESCEFGCPFGKVPRCGEEQAEKCRQSVRDAEEKAQQEYKEAMKQFTFRVDGSTELEAEKDYPFRASLTKVARCGMCKNTKRQMGYVRECTEGLKLKYPLINKEHDCEKYVYQPHFIIPVPDDKIHVFTGFIDRLPECNECANQLYGYCKGIHWFPFEQKEGVCEFFRHKDKVCKHAVPRMQYGETTRNNFCKLDPKNRDGDMAQGWTWNCIYAHTKRAEEYNCYEPIGDDK